MATIEELLNLLVDSKASAAAAEHPEQLAGPGVESSPLVPVQSQAQTPQQTPQDFLTNVMRGRALIGGKAAGDPTGRWTDVGAISYLNQLQPIAALKAKQDQENAKALAFAQGIRGFQGALQSGDLEGAAAMIPMFAQQGMSEKAVQQLEGHLNRERERRRTVGMNEMIGKAGQAAGINPAILAGMQELVRLDPSKAEQTLRDIHQYQKDQEKNQQGQIVSGPGGSQHRVLPDNTVIPLIAGTPEKPAALDAKTQGVMGTLGMSPQEYSDALTSKDPVRIESANATAKKAMTIIRGDEALTRMGFDKELGETINKMGLKYNSLEVAQMMEGTPEQRKEGAKIIAAAQRLQDERKVRALVDTAEKTKGIDDSLPFQQAGQEFYNQKTGKSTIITKGQARNPKIWFTNGGDVVPVTATEAQQMRFMESEIDPSLTAAKSLSKKLLANKELANIPQGANLDTRKWTGSADVAQFKEEMRKLTVAEARIEGGSVRIPVTMMKMLEGTLPTTYSTLQQAERLLNSFNASGENRRRGFLKRTDFVPIPTEEGEWVTVTTDSLDKMFKAAPKPGSAGSPWKEVK